MTRTIDLGELPHHGYPTMDAADRQATQSARWGDARRWRPWLGMVAAAVLVTAVHADGPPAADWAEHRFAVPGEPLYLDADTLYTLRTLDFGSQTLAAYRLADGAPLWEVSRAVGRSTGESESMMVMRHGQFSVVDGIPLHTDLLHVMRDGVFHAAEAVTTAFDPASGEPLWVRDGALIGEASADLLVLELATPQQPLPRSKSAVNVHTGEIAWHVQKAAGHTRVGGEHLVAFDSEGHLTSYDAATGTPTASTALGRTVQLAPEIAYDLVLIRQPDEVTALAADTLAQRWTTPTHPDSFVHGCHDAVCVHEPQGVTVLDPVTGAPRWSFDWPAVGPGRHMVRDLPPPWPESSLLLYAFDTQTITQHTQVVNARTGAMVADLDAWRPLIDGGPGTVLTRVTATGRTWFGRFLPEVPGVEVLGTLDGVSACHGTDRHLACQAGTEVQVWQIRS